VRFGNFVLSRDEALSLTDADWFIPHHVTVIAMKQLPHISFSDCYERWRKSKKWNFGIMEHIRGLTTCEKYSDFSMILFTVTYFGCVFCEHGDAYYGFLGCRLLSMYQRKLPPPSSGYSRMKIYMLRQM
jgi:hypothetical protein